MKKDYSLIQLILYILLVLFACFLGEIVLFVSLTAIFSASNVQTSLGLTTEQIFELIVNLSSVPYLIAIPLFIPKINNRHKVLKTILKILCFITAAQFAGALIYFAIICIRG